jgi:hypothetical protein
MAVPHHAVPAWAGLLHDARDVYVYLYKLEIIFSQKPNSTTSDVPVSIPGVNRSFPEKAPFRAKGHVGRHEESRTASALPCRSEVAERRCLERLEGWRLRIRLVAVLHDPIPA